MIVCCGPPSSGTRLLHGVVRDRFRVHHSEVYHMAMPAEGLWWSWRDFDDASRFVVIQRRPDATVKSALAANHPTLPETAAGMHAMWLRSIECLAAIPNAYWLSYEALVANPRQQVDNLGAWLGMKWSGPLGIYDANAKWVGES